MFPSIPQKQCTKCKRVFPLTHDYFSYNRSIKIGFQCWCKECQKQHKRNKDQQKRIDRGMIQIPDGYRMCGVCREIKPATKEYFTSNKMGKDGLQSFCKSCGAKQQKEYRKLHPERVSITEKKRNKSPKRRQLRLIYGRKNYYSDPFKKEKLRSKNTKRRARLNGAEGFHTTEDEQLQYKSQKGLCWWCGCELNGKFEIDHINPLSRGGSDWPNNIVCSCVFCNRSKHNKLPSEWIGRLM